MDTIAVPIAQAKYERLTRVAEERHQSPAELVDELVGGFLATAQPDKQNPEVEARMKAVDEARHLYPGECVAVREGQILAHAESVVNLIRIVKKEYALSPADFVISFLDEPRVAEDLIIRSPKLVR